MNKIQLAENSNEIQESYEVMKLKQSSINYKQFIGVGLYGILNN